MKGYLNILVASDVGFIRVHPVDVLIESGHCVGILNSLVLLVHGGC